MSQEQSDNLVRENRNLREHVRILRKAGRAVIESWENGDLAGAVRKLAAALEATKD